MIKKYTSQFLAPLKSLKRYHNNLRKKKNSDSETLKVLNNTKEWQECAAFWSNNFEAIHTISTLELLDFVKGESLSTKEIDAFKRGLAVLPNFLQKCKEDVEKEKKNVFVEEKNSV